MKPYTCCFFGHRETNITERLKNSLYTVLENLIINENVNTFLFGSKSRFNDLCLEITTKLKEKHPHIKRVYVRAEYQYISDEYKNYLLESYESTFYPERIINSGKAAYVERNYEMINNSDFCVVYYDNTIAPTSRKSGTKIALDYAIKHNKAIINVAE